MKILIAGGSGFIGRALIDYLKSTGYEVITLTRDQKARGVYWDPEKKILDLDQIQGVDIVISLNGINIVKQRWSKSFKQKILHSRIQSSSFLAKSISRLKKPPRLFLQASATGYYGKCINRVDENAPSGDLFLSKVCTLWEHSVESLPKETRKVFLRFGTVLGKNGGVLQKIIPIFKVMLGGVIGGRKNKISWITIEDLVGSIQHIIDHKEISGPVNLTTPHSVTAKEFYETIAKSLSRPCFLSIPSIFIKLFFGQMGSELLDTSVDVYPKKLLTYGYNFKYPELKGAINHILENK